MQYIPDAHSFEVFGVIRLFSPDLLDVQCKVVEALQSDQSFSRGEWIPVNWSIGLKRSMTKKHLTSKHDRNELASGNVHR